MSLRKGDSSKKGQKHKNVTSYKPGLHVKNSHTQGIAAITLPGLCARCKEKIEWKKKYDKYKPLTAPKKCILCQRKAVKQAYYQICSECAESCEVCAKCGKKDDCLERFPPSKAEQAREEAGFREDLKHLKERERRTLLRESGSHVTGPVTPAVSDDIHMRGHVTQEEAAGTPMLSSNKGDSGSELAKDDNDGHLLVGSRDEERCASEEHRREDKCTVSRSQSDTEYV